VAQNPPFAGLRSGSQPGSAGGIVGWLFAKQAEFYRQFSGLIRSAKADGSAVWSLLGLSFLYGVFHAAGPGHGKAVISAYVVANAETWIRGVVLSLASALLQALAAIAIVGVAAALLNARASTMNGAVNVIESASYALIIIIGVRLLWVKGRIFLAALRASGHPISEVGAAVTPRHIMTTMTSIRHPCPALATRTPITRMPAARITPTPRHRRNSAGLADGGAD
jgi:nickel/cobalt transporter (NicO) family protein